MSKSPSLRRIKADIRELSVDPSDQYHAEPLENDMFEWHFTIRGAADTEFEGGVYHGRILLPPEYPFKPPHIMFLTPSGRFETNTKVCLSFSAHHPELWQPAWGIRLILEALISFLPTPADGAIGALDWTAGERKRLAKASLSFRCPMCCGDGETCVDLLPELKPAAKGDGGRDDLGVDGKGEKTIKKTKFQEEIEKLKMLQMQNHAIQEEEGESAEENDSKPASEKRPAEASKVAEGGSNEARPTQGGIGLAAVVPSLGSENHAPSSDNKAVGAAQVSDEGAAREPEAVTAGEYQVGENRAVDPSASSLARNGAESAAAINPEQQVVAPNAPLVSDSFLNGAIAVLAAAVFLLFRKAQYLVDELMSLEE